MFRHSESAQRMLGREGVTTAADDAPKLIRMSPLRHSFGAHTLPPPQSEDSKTFVKGKRLNASTINRPRYEIGRSVVLLLLLPLLIISEIFYRRELCHCGRLRFQEAQICILEWRVAERNFPAQFLIPGGEKSRIANHRKWLPLETQLAKKS